MNLLHEYGGASGAVANITPRDVDAQVEMSKVSDDGDQMFSSLGFWNVFPLNL